MHQDLLDRIYKPKIRTNWRAKELIHKGNSAIGKLRAATAELLGITEINQLMYATASVLTEDIGATIHIKKGQTYK